MLLLFRQETLVSYRHQAGPITARPVSKSNSLSAETIAEAKAMGLLDGKVAVVTGAGSGIGRGVALGLAAAGASVVVNDYGVTVDGRDPSSDRALGVVKEIETRGGRAVANADSVATMAGGQAMIDAALNTFGDLHVVVCCAGILKERMIFNMTEEEWDSVVAVHLKGHFTVMRPATKHMRERRYGRIVTFTSTAGLEGSPGQPNYSAAKEGIVGLTRSTALAMAKYGVTVNCISPTAETRMTERLPDGRRAEAAAPPEAIAPVVAFLASDRAAHITGQILHVRGNQCRSGRTRRRSAPSRAARGGRRKPSLMSTILRSVRIACDASTRSGSRGRLAPVSRCGSRSASARQSRRAAARPGAVAARPGGRAARLHPRAARDRPALHPRARLAE